LTRQLCMCDGDDQEIRQRENYLMQFHFFANLKVVLICSKPPVCGALEEQLRLTGLNQPSSRANN
jgi:hypothetical protein